MHFWRSPRGAARATHSFSHTAAAAQHGQGRPQGGRPGRPAGDILLWRRTGGVGGGASVKIGSNMKWKMKWNMSSFSCMIIMKSRSCEKIKLLRCSAFSSRKWKNTLKFSETRDEKCKACVCLSLSLCLSYDVSLNNSSLHENVLDFCNWRGVKDGNLIDRVSCSGLFQMFLKVSYCFKKLCVVLHFDIIILVM